MIIYFITTTYRRISIHPLSEFAYAFDCTFFRLIDLTAKALHRMTMNGFLVGATKPKKHTLKQIVVTVSAVPSKKLYALILVKFLV